MPYSSRAAKQKCQREWLQNNRKTWLAVNGPCVRCRSQRDLQVDHIDPAEKLSHKIWSWSKARREAELAKCQVLCRDCHQVKSVNEIVRDPIGRFISRPQI